MKKLIINEELHEKVALQSLAQPEKEEFSVSEDPEVVVFDFEPMKRYFVYIPKVYMNNDGKVFQKIRALSHSVYRNGNYMGTYRCIRDLVIPEIGLDGECPLCDGVADSWDSYRLKVEMKCLEKGLNPDDRTNEEVANIAKTMLKTREIQESKAYVYFPIVVFEMDKDGGKILFNNGEPVYSIQVYAISEYSFKSIWEVQMVNHGIDSLDGSFVVLSYTYETKGKAPSKRDAGRSLQVTFRAQPPETLRPFLDRIDEEASKLSVSKISNALLSLALYSKSDLESIKNKVLSTFYQIKAKEEQKLLVGGETPKVVTSVEDVIASFGADSII